MPCLPQHDGIDTRVRKRQLLGRSLERRHAGHRTAERREHHGVGIDGDDLGVRRLRENPGELSCAGTDIGDPT